MTGLDDDVARIVARTESRLVDHPDPGPVLSGLAERLRHLAGAWDLRLGEVYTAGLGTPVVAVTAGGSPAVLKLGAADEAFRAQVATLVAAGGRGYAAVLAHDTDRGAVLLERLGPSLAEADLSPADQVDHLAATVRVAWEVPLEVAPPVGTGEDKASVLVAIVERLRRPEDEPRWGAALDLAHAWALDLARTRNPARDVLCHGDLHPGNALASAGPTAYRLVDPDGFRAEPEYDVGVGLRDFSREIVALGDPDAAATWLRGLCVRFAGATGTDPDRAWRWALVERVTTGLYLRWFADHDTSASFLDAAALLAASADVLGSGRPGDQVP